MTGQFLYIYIYRRSIRGDTNTTMNTPPTQELVERNDVIVFGGRLLHSLALGHAFPGLGILQLPFVRDRLLGNIHAARGRLFVRIHDENVIILCRGSCWGGCSIYLRL